MQQFKKEQNLIVEMSVAKELGMNLTQLREGMTPEEVQLWVLFFNYQNEMQDQAMKKAQNRR